MIYFCSCATIQCASGYCQKFLKSGDHSGAIDEMSIVVDREFYLKQNIEKSNMMMKRKDVEKLKIIMRTKHAEKCSE